MAERISPAVPKPLAGFIFLLFCAGGIVVWCIVNSSRDLGVHGLTVDVGLVFAFAGTAALFVRTRSGLVAIFVYSIIGIGLFAVGDLLHIVVLTYALRILGIALAFAIVPANRLIGSLRVLS